MSLDESVENEDRKMEEFRTNQKECGLSPIEKKYENSGPGFWKKLITHPIAIVTAVIGIAIPLGIIYIQGITKHMEQRIYKNNMPSHHVVRFKEAEQHVISFYADINGDDVITKEEVRTLKINIAKKNNCIFNEEPDLAAFTDKNGKGKTISEVIEMYNHYQR